MIRIGVDVVDVARLEDRLARWPRLANRLFTPGELEYSRARPRPSDHLAARVAAKEATFKALGVGWPEVAWTDVGVERSDGRPSLVLTGRAAELAGSASTSVSLSHDAGVAVAQVLLVDD